MVDVNIEKLQARSQALYGLDYPGGMKIASGLTFDPNGICRTLWGKELNACFTELLGDDVGGQNGLLSTHALLLNGASGGWVSTPDAAALDIIGDIDIRVELQPFITGGITQTIIGKWGGAGTRSYRLQTVFGLLGLKWSVDGTAELGNTLVSLPQGAATGAVRTTLDVVNGANRTMETFTSPSLGAGTLLATETVAGNTSIFSGSAVLGIGGDTGGAGNNFTGRILRAELRNAINGTVVANPDFRNLSPGTTSFVDAAGLTWTLAGSARIV